MKRGADGWVLSMQVPGPDASNPVTVYWSGDGGIWVPCQKDAARYADEALARHRLDAADARPRPRPGFSGTVYCTPALAARNGGPTTPIVAAGGGDPQPAPAEVVQGDLFGGAR